MCVPTLYWQRRCHSNNDGFSQPFVPRAFVPEEWRVTLSNKTGSGLHNAPNLNPPRGKRRTRVTHLVTNGNIGRVTHARREPEQRGAFTAAKVYVSVV